MFERRLVRDRARVWVERPLGGYVARRRSAVLFGKPVSRTRAEMDVFGRIVLGTENALAPG